MLKLQVFLPCQQSIIDKEEMASVINILDSVTLESDGSEDIKPDAAIPMQWEVFTIWRKTSDDDNKKVFEQRVELLRPDGHSVFNAPQPIKIDASHYNYRALTKVGAMPVGQAGIMSLKIFIREVGDSNSWQQAGEYFIHMVHKIKKEVRSVKTSSKKRRK